MTEKEKQILDKFRKVLPTLSEREQDNLLCFGEGYAFKAAQENERNHRKPESA